MSHRILLVLLISTMFGCSGNSSMPVATPVAFNAAGAATVQFSAPDMMCPEGCGEKVKEILSEQPGAKEVVVDFDNKTAIVAVEDGAKFDANAAVAALADHGFKNSSVKTDGEATVPAGGVSDSTPPAATEKPKDGSAG